ncbi:MAG: hypothetical protein ACE5IL_08525 [Myxococcota bacterium]
MYGAPTMDPDQERRERRRWILTRGVAGWGLPTGILWGLFMSAHHPDFLWLSLAIGVLLFPIGGWLWGSVMWRVLRLGTHARGREG